MGLKTEIFDDEKFEVTYEAALAYDVEEFSVDLGIANRRKELHEEMNGIDGELESLEAKVSKLNSEIDKLTNHADGVDYMVAVASGVIAGLIDVFFVEDFSFEKANQWGDDKVNDFVIKIAQAKGYKGDDLEGAVRFLEKNYAIAADKATNDFGGGKQHHLRDFSHHPTPIGLFFSLLTQFTHKVYGTNTAGVFVVLELKEDAFQLIGKNFPEKITFGVINWVFHIVSDMAGSSTAIANGKAGTGLPGPLVSMLKEISALPIFRKLNEDGNKEISVWISQLFNGTLLGKRDENGKLIPIKFDLRTELGVLYQLGQQAIPVMINECIVRSFYFIRRFYLELKANNVKKIQELKNINWERTLPFKNRTVVRMLTISTGTMTAIDIADAAIESAVKSKGLSSEFLRNMIVKVNFVGIGRFAIAVGSDVGMGIKRSRLRNERIRIVNQQLTLLNAKVFFSQAEFNYALADAFDEQKQVWYAAEDAVATLEEAYKTTEKAIVLYFDEMKMMQESMQNISKYQKGINQHNPDLLKNLDDIFKWG